MGLNEKVYGLCARVPRGRVTTYREIGLAIGTSAFRAIGQSLAKNPFAPRVPCHRVVCTDGSVGGFNGSVDNTKKIQLLRKEGIEIKKNRIKNFEKVLFKF